MAVHTLLFKTTTGKQDAPVPLSFLMFVEAQHTSIREGEQGLIRSRLSATTPALRLRLHNFDPFHRALGALASGRQLPPAYPTSGRGESSPTDTLTSMLPGISRKRQVRSNIR